MSHLEEKKIFITGASRGIGRGIAIELANRGAILAIGYSQSQERAKSLIKDLPGEGHLLIHVDICNEDQVQNAIQKILAQWKKIDGVVNNAGITADQILLRMKAEDFDHVIQTNLRGTFLVTRAVLKPMMRAGSGSIVNITSVIAHSGNSGQTNYAASKAGIEGFSRSVALEMASRNLRSNCVAPGFIETEMTKKLTNAQRENILKNIPLKAIGEPKDVANAVAYLLSDDSRYVTGQTLHVNGGLYLN